MRSNGSGRGAFPGKCSQGSVPWEAFPACRISSSAGMRRDGRRDPTGRGSVWGALPSPCRWDSRAGGSASQASWSPRRFLVGSEPPHTRLPRGRNTQECRESQQSMCSPCSQGAGRALGDTFALSGACCCVAAQISSSCWVLIPSKWKLLAPTPLSTPRVLGEVLQEQFLQEEFLPPVLLGCPGTSCCCVLMNLSFQIHLLSSNPSGRTTHSPIS